MTRAFHIIFCLAVLNGCGTANSGLQTPVADMRGVDQTAYNRDIAACLENRPFFMPNNYLVTCMQGKGYKMLAQY